MKPARKPIVSREYRVIVTVEEVEAAKVVELPKTAGLSPEAQEFLDEEDYSMG